MSTILNDNRLPQEAGEEMMKYNEPDILVRRSIMELVRSVATRYIGMKICIRMAIFSW